MDRDERELEMATAYLRDCKGLRAALGIGDDAVLEPRFLGAGEHNLNFWFTNPANEERYVLRINVAAQPFHRDQVAYEHAALRALEPSGCTPKPWYLDNGPSAPEKGALVISYCEGDELDFDNLREGDLRCAAQIMANVHAVPVGADCPLYRPADPLKSLFDECLDRFKAYRSSAFEDGRITKWAESFMAAASQSLQAPCDRSDCSHIVNTETLPSHFLIPASSAQAACAAMDGRGVFCNHPGSFVDWERPIIGEVAQDVAYFVSPTTTYWDSEFLFPADDVEQFVEDYWQAVDGRFSRGGFDARFQAWRMMTALRSVTWCCRALVQYGAAGTRKTEKTALKLPVYLSDEFMERVASDCFGM